MAGNANERSVTAIKADELYRQEVKELNHQLYDAYKRIKDLQDQIISLSERVTDLEAIEQAYNRLFKH